MSPDPEPPGPAPVDPPHDLRLAPSLAAACLAALLVVRLSAPAAVAAALLAAVLAGGSASAGWLLARGRARGLGNRTGALVLRAAALALAVAATTFAAGAAQTDSRESGPWRRLDGAVVVVEGRVTGDPVLLPPAWPGAPARAAWMLTAERVRTAGAAPRSQAARAPVRVLGPASGLPDFDARVRVRGRLVRSPAGERAVAVVLSSDAPVLVGPPGRAHRLARSVRAAEQELAQRLPGDAGALLPGVTVGDTTRVPDDLRAAMRAAGLTHLTAVSGSHFSLVATLTLTVAAVSGVRRRWCPAVVVGAMAAMVVLVHPSASVVRAAAMGLVGVWGMLLGRPARAPAALAAAAIVLLVADPWLAGELGFVLSVLATAGIVLLAGPLARRWEPALGRTFAPALAVPVAAQLACGPAVVAIAPAFTTYAIPANLAAAPAVAPATVLGLLAGALEPWCAPLAHALAWGAGAACWWIGAVARVASHAPGASVPWLSGAAGVGVLAVAGLCVSRLLVSRR